MSLIGKLPIKIPEGVSVNLDNQTVVVTGPKGELRINDDESKELRYFPINTLPELETRAEMVIRRLKRN